MARPIRVTYPGAVYHVISRGNNKQKIFMDDRDCERYLEVLEESVEIFGIHLCAYVLMGNHLHLLIKTPEANISEFMRRLHLTYTGYINYRHNRSGHLFQGRFKSFLVQEDRYLIALSRYIHLNPIRTRNMASRSITEKINHLKTYRWSSLEGYRKRSRQKSFIRYELLLESYGGNNPKGRRGYWDSLRNLIEDKKEDDLPGEIFGGFVLGSKEFAQGILESIREGESTDVCSERTLRLQVKEVDFWQRVEGLTNMNKEEILNHRSVVRNVVIEALCYYVGMSGSAVAKLFNLHESSVSKYRKRVREIITKDEDIRSLWTSLTS